MASSSHGGATFRALSFASLGLSALTGIATGQCWDQHLDTDPAGTTRPSPVSAGTLLSGAAAFALGQPRNNHAGSPSIRDEVHVFEDGPNGFASAGVLTNPRALHADDSFGVALKLDGDLLAVGDPELPQGGPQSGAVHLYRRLSSGWTLGETIDAPAYGLTTQLFGGALDLEGNTLVVGAPASTSSTAGSLENGVVFVFERTAAGWNLAQTIEHPTEPLFGFFGAALDLDGNRLAIGSPGDASPAGNAGAGAIYLFERSGGAFALVERVQSSPSLPQSGFGRSVALSGTVLAAGAAGEEVNGFHQGGRAYVFEEASAVWAQMARLQEAPFRARHRFGDSVAIFDDSVLVTSAGTTAVHAFERGAASWTSEQRYTTAAGVSWPGQLETRVGVVGDRVILSGLAGATVFERDPEASVTVGCAGLPQPTLNPGTAPPAYLDIRSEARLSNPSTDLLMIGGSSGNNGILFYGFTPTNVPLGSGNLCVTGPLARAAFGSATSGQTEIVLDHGSAPVASGPAAIAPGTPVHFQYWFRVPSGSHTTNSLVVTYCP